MIDWFYVGCLVVDLILFFAGGIYFQGTDWGISLVFVGFGIIMVASIMVMAAILESAPDEVVTLYANGTALLGNGSVINLWEG